MQLSPSTHKKFKGIEAELKARPASRKGGLQIFCYGEFKGKAQTLKQTRPNVHSVLTRDENERKLTEAAAKSSDEDFEERFAQEVEKLLARELAST